MATFKKMLNLAAEVTSVTFSVLSELIDQWGTGVTRDELERRSRGYALKCAELECELDLLSDQSAQKDDLIDHLKFNGPTLYKNEIDALCYAAGVLQNNLMFTPEAMTHQRSLLGLLKRGDEVPISTNEIVNVMVDAIAEVDDDNMLDRFTQMCHGTLEKK